MTHLDTLFWLPGWQPAPRAEAVDQLAAVVATDAWILDGNFLDDVEVDGRLDRADTVILVDLPPVVCLSRVVVRLVRDRRRERADLPDGCRESFDPAGLRWILTYARRERPAVLRLLAELGPGVTVHRLCSRRAVRRLVAQLP